MLEIIGGNQKTSEGLYEKRMGYSLRNKSKIYQLGSLFFTTML